MTSPSSVFPRPVAPVSGPVARRLLLAVIGMGSIILTVITMNVINSVRYPSPALSMGLDLLPSYVAGKFVREGRPRAMYDIATLRAEEVRVSAAAALHIEELKKDANGNDRFGPWLNPPFFAWVFAPLAHLPYRKAAAVFLACNLILLAASLVLLCRMLRGQPRRSAGVTITPIHCGDDAFERNARRLHVLLVPAILFSTMPFWQALCHQQNTFISLLLLTVTVTLWLGGRYTAAGLVAGLLFFKPQLAMVVAVVLAASGGWRAVVGLAATGIALLAVTLLTLPHTLVDYLTAFPRTMHMLQTQAPYAWGRHVTFLAMWRLLFQGHAIGPTQQLPRLLTGLSSGVIALLLGATTWNTARKTEPRIRRRLIGAAIVSMPVLMPYYMDYDLLLLAVPAVLFAHDWITREVGKPPVLDKVQLGLWIALAVETELNPGLAAQTRFDLAAPILAGLSLVSIAGCALLSDLLPEYLASEKQTEREGDSPRRRKASAIAA